MKKTRFVNMLLSICIGLFSCAPILTLPMHSPLYPEGMDSAAGVFGEEVEFEITANSEDGIKRIEFWEIINQINKEGNDPATGREVVLKTRNWPDIQPDEEMIYSGNNNSEIFTFTRGPYRKNSFIQYRFKVIAAGLGYTRSNVIGFATRPHPVINIDNNKPVPAPVYVQAHPEDVFDVVFIPDVNLHVDTDPAAMQNFQARCTSLITEALFKEPTLKYLRRQFNFYINPETGTAKSGSSNGCSHVVPSNWENLSTFEAKPILHEATSWRNYKCPDPDILSITMSRLETMRHEMGHEFGLFDEYDTGEHVENWPFPNNWNDKTVAEWESWIRGRTPSNVQWIENAGGMDWYKICFDNHCIMESTSSLYPFDIPCSHRVIYNVLINPNSDKDEGLEE